jgi:hypothetical protein
MKTKKYDAIIIGTGPAGIFAALELLHAKGLRVLLLEKGGDLHERDRSNPAAILSGWGGSGAFSDGKLNLSPLVGGSLSDFITTDKLEKLITYVDETYLRFGAPKFLYGMDADRIALIRRKATHANLKLVPSRVRHIGTENCVQLLSKIQKHLKGKVEIQFHSPVVKILSDGGKVQGVQLKNEKI